MKYFFTADYHLGHDKIREYCLRPFKSLEQMNNTIIRHHNERVKSEDTVFHIGDFCFKGGKEGSKDFARAWREKLNGNIIFIRGNHDKNNSLKTIIEKVVISYGGHDVCLVHDPAHADFKYDLNFIVHIHNYWTFNRLVSLENITDLVNVGVDVWGFYPHTFEEIYKKYKEWKRHGNKRTVP